MIKKIAVILWTIGLFLLVSCQSNKKESGSEIESPIVAPDSSADSDEFILPENRDWDYDSFYGEYVHESNTKGFTAYLNISPEGNDLTFTISVQQQACSGQASGTIGMAIHYETEYGGFFDNNDCRIEFIFALQENTIRVQEVGYCTLHEAGCSFNGRYIRKR